MICDRKASDGNFVVHRPQDIRHVRDRDFMNVSSRLRRLGNGGYRADENNESCNDFYGEPRSTLTYLAIRGAAPTLARR